MFIGSNILNNVYKERKPWSHKGDFGSLLIIGGSKVYSGSPALNALAAYRSGVDLVTVVAPRRAADIIASFRPDIITYPLEGDYLRKRHLKEVFRLVKGKDAVVIGGGLGRERETLSAIRRFLVRIDLPCVIDADAIHVVDKDLIHGRPFVVTPHGGEFLSFTGIKPSEFINVRIREVIREAREFKTTILLKGHIDVVANSEKNILNNTGCPEMTVGGTGDVLAGILGSLIAQGNNLFESACAAAYINGKAGELVAKEKKQGLMASDLIEKIPEVIKNAY